MWSLMNHRDWSIFDADTRCTVQEKEKFYFISKLPPYFNFYQIALILKFDNFVCIGILPYNILQNFKRKPHHWFVLNYSKIRTFVWKWVQPTMKLNQNQSFLVVVNFQDDIHIIQMMGKEISESVVDRHHSIHWQKNAALMELHANLVNVHKMTLKLWNKNRMILCHTQKLSFFKVLKLILLIWF